MKAKQPFSGTCIAPNGVFFYGIHKPAYTAYNYRENDWLVTLGKTRDEQPVDNERNFPQRDVEAPSSAWVYEIPNPFPFMGVTFIPKSSADRRSHECNPFLWISQQRERDRTSVEPEMSSLDTMQQTRPSLLALARTTRNAAVLVKLAEKSCRFIHEDPGEGPSGLMYERMPEGTLRPSIIDGHLFELVSNNPCLPDRYKRCMVLTPGVQGDSPIVGEYRNHETHVWEYLRENSYIPWGHYAANMAQDAVRYTVGTLSFQDVSGLRHLYYQRVFTQLAEVTGEKRTKKRQTLSVDNLEEIRLALTDIFPSKVTDQAFPFTGNIWGQNFGFDLSPSGYRLNASHQQIHQQYALVPPTIPTFQGGKEVPEYRAMPTFILGDLVARFTTEYRDATGLPFFETFLKALATNERMDGSVDKPRSLIVYEDECSAVYVPKAQRSQGEIQIISKVPCGNILEADTAVRQSLDRSIFVALKVLEGLGAEMITVFEVSKRFDNPDTDQRLVYCFLPRHPQSPGSFTELQQRWIIGHYPEDFAHTCRKVLGNMDILNNT